MTVQDRTGRPAVPTRPRRAVAAALAFSVGLAVAGTAVAAASRPAGRTAVALAAAEPPEPGTVTFRVVPAPTTAPPTPPTPQPPTPRPTPSGHLPVTGGGGDPASGWLPALGALLVLTGTLIVVAARRSRRPGDAGPTG
ncbi:hypothetical protein GCM10022225_32110 [Plantactinospora mayteni]|uniref:Gram-positive cocci surface proteins LPxTG domain-containing protein n=1 Tax=Plantactinospora mayteni TaxID=566021 RepID=A0ABQ4ELQ0_9ACTN|nr:hypothetical protein [Plantactinospora mayteni]GIG95625.1 hypothetical protein Pma05_21980 [Plantactinospora mayteni]